MIHIYTGEGKGKTTSAIGLAIRAAGHGMSVLFAQFLKPKMLKSGEEGPLSSIKNIEFVKFDHCHPMFVKRNSRRKKAKERLRIAVNRDFEKIRRRIARHRFDLIVLDEIINAYDQGFLDRESLEGFLKKIPQGTEVILTGRGDTAPLKKYADYISEIREVKHPYAIIGHARRGIEF